MKKMGSLFNMSTKSRLLSIVARRILLKLRDILIQKSHFLNVIIFSVFHPTENPLLSDLVTHGVSILLLALLNCSNTVLVRGVYIDAEEPDGQCVVFPVYYIRLFFQKERLKKQKRILDTERGGGGTANVHAAHHSLRQQLLRHNEKSPTILPMNKLSSSHINLSTNSHQLLGQPQQQHLQPPSINNSKIHNSHGSDEEWRRSKSRNQSLDDGADGEEAPTVIEATKISSVDC